MCSGPPTHPCLGPPTPPPGQAGADSLRLTRGMFAGFQAGEGEAGRGQGRRHEEPRRESVAPALRPRPRHMRPSTVTGRSSPTSPACAFPSWSGGTWRSLEKLLARGHQSIRTSSIVGPCPLTGARAFMLPFLMCHVRSGLGSFRSWEMTKTYRSECSAGSTVKDKSDSQGHHQMDVGVHGHSCQMTSDRNCEAVPGGQTPYSEPLCATPSSGG